MIPVHARSYADYWNVELSANASTREFALLVDEQIADPDDPLSMYHVYTANRDESHENSIGSSVLFTYVSLYIGIILLISAGIILALKLLAPLYNDARSHALLEKLVAENRPFTREGRVAGYIPELAKADRDELGICVVSSDGRISSAGEYRRTFTIQSIIKPILLLLALMDNGEDTVRARVGVEATGKPFDAINYTDQALLSEHLNPMVNMGAILLCTLIHGTSYSQRLERLLELTRRLAGDPSLSVDEAVYRSEKQTGSRNRAMAFLLESCGLLHDDPEEVLDCYFRACSIRVDCRDLAHIACTFAGRGRRSPSGERLFPARYAHYVNAVLMTCGMYNGSGDFAAKVGLPAKSGVGGGIMAVSPARMGIGIYSGIRLLEQLGRRLSLSIF